MNHTCFPKARCLFFCFSCNQPFVLVGCCMFGDSQILHSTVVVTHSTERCNRSLCVSTDEIRVYCFTGVCSGALLQAWYNEYLRWSVAGVAQRVPALVAGRLRRHRAHPAAVRLRVDARHRSLQQVRYTEIQCTAQRAST